MSSKLLLAILLVFLFEIFQVANAVASTNEAQKPNIRAVRSVRADTKSKITNGIDKGGEDSEEDDDDDDDTSEGSGNDENNQDGDDDDEEGDGKSKRVVCKRTCAPPMTFEECSNPRCSLKHNMVRDLCFFLCKHQQVRCTNTCDSD
eukprot:gene13323-4169_t